jgi:hypothetical protein
MSASVLAVSTDGQKFVLTFLVEDHMRLRREAYQRTIEQGRNVPMTEIVVEATRRDLDESERTREAGQTPGLDRVRAV